MTAPAVPSVNDALTTAAGSLTTQFFDTFGSVLPYAVAMLGLAWGFATVKNMIGARKKAPK
jgi:hypothetical protein